MISARFSDNRRTLIAREDDESEEYKKSYFYVKTIGRNVHVIYCT